MKEIAYDKNFEFEEDYWWFVGRRKIILTLFENILKKTKPKILDFGCGTGITLTYLKEYGDTAGYDISPHSFEYCKKRGLDNLYSDKDFHKLKNKSIDFVFMMDVLEHFEDESKELSKVKEKLKNNNSVLITVPAFNFLWGGEDHVSNHKRRYTKSSLRKLLEFNGFEIQKISYYNFFLLPLISLIIFYKRFFVKNGRYQSNLKSINRITNKILSLILSIEAVILKKYSFPVGASIVCVAKLKK